MNIKITISIINTYYIFIITIILKSKYNSFNLFNLDKVNPKYLDPISPI